MCRNPINTIPSKLSLIPAVTLCCLFGAAWCVPVAAEVSYDCYRTVDAITLDGVLTEVSWQQAAPSSDFVIWDGSAVAPQRSVVKAVWDEQMLYVAFDFADVDIYATYTNRDASLWEQDVCEVFVRVPGNPTAYVEFEVSPIGTVWDGTYTDIFTGPGGSWDSSGFVAGARALGTTNNPADVDTGFVVEMCVPWEDIYKTSAFPAHGETISMNFNRVDVDTPDPPEGRGDNPTYAGWSPTPGPYVSFHRPEEFGMVTFHNQSAPGPEVTITRLCRSGGSVIMEWQANRTNLVFRVESRASLSAGEWFPAAPTSQWWISSTVWTNTGLAGDREFLRVKARQE